MHITSPLHNPIRADWLNSGEHEEVIHPAQAIVDSHHHLYDRPGLRYLLDEYLHDINSGHNVRASVIVQARSMLRAGVPRSLQPLGETEFANGVAAMSASGIYGDVRVGAAIVGFAELAMGDEIQPILEKHVSLAGGMANKGGRFRGIRSPLAWSSDHTLLNAAYPTVEGLMDSCEFRAGMRHLAPFGLSFEAWVFFYQLPRLTALARAFPGTPIVVNHCGGILGVNQFSDRRGEVFNQWSQALKDLSLCPNVMIKLSGLGMKLSGFGFERMNRSPNSQELAEAWRPYLETCLDLFGARRCMYGSNFPVDKGSYRFMVGVNALKRVTAAASADEKDDIFWRTASTFYRLSEMDESEL